jgi:hypothetical protein
LKSKAEIIQRTPSISKTPQGKRKLEKSVSDLGIDSPKTQTLSITGFLAVLFIKTSVSDEFCFMFFLRGGFTGIGAFFTTCFGRGLGFETSFDP